MGQGPLEIDHSGIEVKKYPACYAVHRPLDGLFHLMRTHGVEFDNVDGVNIETSSGAMALLIPEVPRSGMHGKFSMSYAIAAALVDRRIGLSTFTDEAVRRLQVRGLMTRVSAYERDGNMLPRFAVVTVRLKSGQIVSNRVDTLHGSLTSPLSDAEFLEKVEDCLSWADSPLSADSVLSAADEIAEGDVTTLVARLTAPIRSRSVSDGSFV